jgi:uncharacterized membrane protein
MKIRRIARHLLTTHAQLGRIFSRSALAAIEKAVTASEASHAGEIRFVVEAALDGMPLFKGQTARERAIDVFSQLRIWDTQHNNGLLIYLLLADRSVEIVADRGIHAKVGSREWSRICGQMETAFRQSSFESGVLEGIQAVARHLTESFPSGGRHLNELPDTPVVL